MNLLRMTSTVSKVKKTNMLFIYAWFEGSDIAGNIHNPR